MPLVLCTLSGCLWTEQPEHASFLNRMQRRPIPAGQALIEVAMVERPIGDAYLNNKIWEHADEMILTDPDRSAALDENGFRIGQLVGTPPDDLQQLLLSKRSCINPQHMLLPAGHTGPIYLGAVLPQSSYEIVQGQTRNEVVLEQARFAFDVTAELTPKGTRLTFLPKVENGEAALPFESVPEAGRWEMRVAKASRKYPDMSWEVTLSANQYLVVGGRLERERTLGQTAFTEIRGDGAVQRVLVVRNCRSITATEAQQSSVEDLVRADQSPPLALQAAMPVSRAKAN
jgi:hypothetical protein